MIEWKELSSKMLNKLGYGVTSALTHCAHPTRLLKNSRKIGILTQYAIERLMPDGLGYTLMIY